MKTVRIGNDITIRWTLVFADSGETLAGRDLKLYLKHPLITKREVTDYIVEDNAVTWVFRGAEQKKTGVYSLELVGNDGADGMWTIDACDAVELVPCTCKTGCPGGDVELFGKVDTLNGNVIVTAVDKELDAESENPIANMAVAKEIEALKENAGSSAFVVETTENLILNLKNNSTSATILNSIGGDFNAIAQAIRDGRQIQFKNTTSGLIINAGLTGYSISGSTESITITLDGNEKQSYKREITNTNGVLKCNVVNMYISNGMRIGSNAYIGENADISDNVRIGSNTYLSDNVRIGSNIHILDITPPTGLQKNIPTIYVKSAGYSSDGDVNGIIIGSEDYNSGLSIFAYDSCAISNVINGTQCVRINYRNVDFRIGTESLYLNGVKLGAGSSSGTSVTPPNISTKVYIVGTYETELGLKCYNDYYGDVIGMEIGTKGSFLGSHAHNSLLLYAYGSASFDAPSALIGTKCIRLGYQDIELYIGSQQMYLNGALVGGGGTGSASNGVIIGFESNVGYDKSGFVFSTSTMGSKSISSIGTDAIIRSGARIGTTAIFGDSGLGRTHVDYGIRIFSLSTCILIEDEKGHSVFLT